MKLDRKPSPPAGPRTPSGATGPSSSEGPNASGGAIPAQGDATGADAFDSLSSHGAGRSEESSASSAPPRSRPVHGDPPTGGRFDRLAEFPNPFGSPSLRATEEELTAGRARTSAVLASVWDRITVPLNGRFVHLGPELVRRVHAVDPEAELRLSGGVVRSLLGHVVEEVDRARREDPDLLPEEVLERLVHSREPLPLQQLASSRGEWKLDVSGRPEARAAAEELAKEIEAGARARGIPEALVPRAFALEADETHPRGGLLNALCFDPAARTLEDSSGGEASQELVCGRFTYRPADPGLPPLERGRRIIQELGTLIQAPFLALRNEDTLRADLAVLQELVTSPVADELGAEVRRVLEEAPAGGAHNRLTRGTPGSLERAVEEVLRPLVTGGKLQRLSALQEYADDLPVVGRERAGLGEIPSELLVSAADLKGKYTLDGWFFHGISLAWAERLGFRPTLSTERQGAAAAGRGVYTTRQAVEAFSYAGSDPLVFFMKLKEGAPLRAIEWEAAGHHPWMAELRIQAKAEGRELHELLSRDHGIDLVASGSYLLIQNLAVVDLPGSPRACLEAAAQLLQANDSAPEACLAALVTYSSLFPYVSSMEPLSLPTPEEVKSQLVQRLLHPESKPELARYLTACWGWGDNPALSLARLPAEIVAQHLPSLAAEPGIPPEVQVTLPHVIKDLLDEGVEEARAALELAVAAVVKIAHDKSERSAIRQGAISALEMLTSFGTSEIGVPRRAFLEDVADLIRDATYRDRYRPWLILSLWTCFEDAQRAPGEEARRAGTVLTGVIAHLTDSALDSKASPPNRLAAVAALGALSSDAERDASPLGLELDVLCEEVGNSLAGEPARWPEVAEVLENLGEPAYALGADVLFRLAVAHPTVAEEMERSFQGAPFTDALVHLAAGAGGARGAGFLQTLVEALSDKSPAGHRNWKQESNAALVKRWFKPEPELALRLDAAQPRNSSGASLASPLVLEVLAALRGST